MPEEKVCVEMTWKALLCLLWLQAGVDLGCWLLTLPAAVVCLKWGEEKSSGLSSRSRPLPNVLELWGGHVGVKGADTHFPPQYSHLSSLRLIRLTCH